MLNQRCMPAGIIWKEETGGCIKHMRQPDHHCLVHGRPQAIVDKKSESYIISKRRKN